MKTQSEKRKTGPKRIEPNEMGEIVNSIKGIDNVYTAKQYKRLVEYIETDIKDREPFIRLGASVPSRKDGNKKPSTSTWVVTVRNKIQIIVREQDPRQAIAWMKNQNRPWNMFPNFVTKEEKETSASET